MSKEQEAFSRPARDEDGPSIMTIGPQYGTDSHASSSSSFSTGSTGPRNQDGGTAAHPQSSTIPGPVTGNDSVCVKPDKSIVDAYLLWFLFGIFGAHHFYLRRPYFGLIYFITWGLLGFGWLIDLFRMPYLVSETNKNPPRNKKTISDAYTLWFPLGIQGLHHFYLGNLWQGILYFFTGGLFGIGWLVDLIRMPSLVKEANERGPEKRERRMLLAYMLAIPPLGFYGNHHFYLNRPVTGIVYLLTCGLGLIGWLVDLFRMPILVKRANKEIREGRDNRKYVDDAYVFWISFGVLGMHHFYLNRPAWGFLYFFTLGLGLVGWIIDGFRMVYLVKDCNTRLDMVSDRTPITRPSVKSEEDEVQGNVDTGIPNYGYRDGQPSNTHPSQYSIQQPQTTFTGSIYTDVQPTAPPDPTYMDQPPPYSP